MRKKDYPKCLLYYRCHQQSLQMTKIQKRSPQEIDHRALQKIPEHKEDKTFSNKFQYYNRAKEDIFHLLCAYDHLSASTCLPKAKIQYNEIAKTVDHKILFVSPKNDVWKYGELEIYVLVTTTSKT